MHPMLEQYFEKKQNEEKKEREALLIREGLYETVEDEASGKSKVVPISVTDEEFEQIKKYAKKTVPVKKKKENEVAKGLKFFGDTVIAVGAVAGLCVGAMCYNVGDFVGILSAISTWIVAGVFGALIRGVGEIVRLLDR